MALFVSDYQLDVMFQSPSLRGSGRFRIAAGIRGAGGRRFQSPSLRGSGRFERRARRSRENRRVSIPFIAGQWSLPEGSGGADEPTLVVSIPFIAGQWSLRQIGRRAAADLARFQSPSLRGSGRFAKVGADLAEARVFQSPSLRGSGRFSTAPSARRSPRSFQSPSLRGSGRFWPCSSLITNSTSCFNPLHCGAVVASLPPCHTAEGGAPCFNPLHCGAVVASIPRGATRFTEACFNPLHCGAVVASRRCRRMCARRRTSFNPLHCGAVVASGRRLPDGARARRVSIPFIAGQWSLRTGWRRRSGCCWRVSIPFIAGQWSLRKEKKERMKGTGFRFNPLHCGAVVASRRTAGGARRNQKVSIPFIAGQWSLLRLHFCPACRRRVSIPFIAGQWSLPDPIWIGRGPPDARFNPLHCGAVVASLTHLRRRRARLRVSIPFIAGQWSLRALTPPGALTSKFQSPSLRGSGRFIKAMTDGEARQLHVSIPFIAGQWSLHMCSCCGAPQSGVSIPFIAGQWSLPRRTAGGQGGRMMFQSPSLRGSGRFSPGREGSRGAEKGFNPLHCGAVVASGAVQYKTNKTKEFQSPSLRGSGRFALAVWRAWAEVQGFNPLHCGAVVASKRNGNLDRSDRHVSIPFIAGQWSLHIARRVDEPTLVKFQSPSLRGSGRFWRRFSSPPRSPYGFNPLHCGAVVASVAKANGLSEAVMFQSPSLRGSGRFNPTLLSLGSPGLQFQSPSLRGSGRFPILAQTTTSRVRLFQSPSLRGSGRFTPPAERGGDPGGPVSIPFIAGQWSLRHPYAYDLIKVWRSFNPLHCGAVVASPRSQAPCGSERRVSIPFIAGQWSLHVRRHGPVPLRHRVSIPFIAGQWSLRRACAA